MSSTRNRLFTEAQREHQIVLDIFDTSLKGYKEIQNDSHKIESLSQFDTYSVFKHLARTTGVDITSEDLYKFMLEQSTDTTPRLAAYIHRIASKNKYSISFEDFCDFVHPEKVFKEGKYSSNKAKVNGSSSKIQRPSSCIPKSSEYYSRAGPNSKVFTRPWERKNENNHGCTTFDSLKSLSSGYQNTICLLNPSLKSIENPSLAPPSAHALSYLHSLLNTVYEANSSLDRAIKRVQSLGVSTSQLFGRVFDPDQTGSITGLDLLRLLNAFFNGVDAAPKNLGQSLKAKDGRRNSFFANKQPLFGRVYAYS